MHIELDDLVLFEHISLVVDVKCFAVLLKLFRMTEIQTREETSRMFFDTEMTMDSQDNLDWEVDNELNNLDRAFSLSGGGGTQAQAQLLLLEEENTRNAERRETEVRHIVKSIVDLNDIFKDLSHMVIDQVSFLWLKLILPSIISKLYVKEFIKSEFWFYFNFRAWHKKISLFLILQMFNLFLYQPFDNFLIIGFYRSKTQERGRS